MAIEGPDIFKYLDDLNGFDEVNRILKAAPKWGDDLSKISKGPLDKVMGPIGTALDAFTTAKGGWQIADGLTGDEANDDLTFVDGIHDILDGGSGIMGNAPGPVGAVAKAFNAGFTVGDMIAPYVFNDAKFEGSRMEDVPEDGEFLPQTGNESVDEIIQGVDHISEGDYLDGALDLADGAIGVGSAFVPGMGVVESGKDIFEFFNGSD